MCSQRSRLREVGGRVGITGRASHACWCTVPVRGPTKQRHGGSGLSLPDPPLFLSALPECHRRTVVAISSRGVLSLRLEPSPILNELEPAVAGGLPRRA